MFGSNSFSTPRSTVRGALVIACVTVCAFWCLRSTLSGKTLWLELMAHVREYGFVGVVALGLAVLLGVYVERRFAILERFATLDTLTLLANRRVFEERLSHELERVQRYAAPMAILIIDVDKLKSLNDCGGHQNGDRAIAAVGEAIRRTCRATDLAARWGGDEFVVLMPCTKSHEAETLARRINAVVRKIAPQRHCPMSVSVSIGVADTSVLGATSDAASALFAAADRALFCAKAAGRACVKVASDEHLDGAEPHVRQIPRPARADFGSIEMESETQQIERRSALPPHTHRS